MSKPLFNVGDKVATRDGTLGTIIEVDNGYSIPMYLLTFGDGDGAGWAMETELSLAA